MTVTEKRELVEQQNKILEEIEDLKGMQTDFSYDIKFYRYCERKITSLSEEAEQINRILGMRCYK